MQSGKTLNCSRRLVNSSLQLPRISTTRIGGVKEPQFFQGLHCFTQKTSKKFHIIENYFTQKIIIKIAVRQTAASWDKLINRQISDKKEECNNFAKNSFI